MIYKYVFPNGITFKHVYSNCDLFNIEIVIKSGMINENHLQVGYTHILEHFMSFFTSNKYPDAHFNYQLLNKWGMTSNAWTEENTCGFYVEGSNDYFMDIIDLMLNSYVFPFIDSKHYQQEQEAVVRELNKIKDDIWYNLIYQLQCYEYPGTAFEYDIDYEQQNVKNATLEKIMNFRKQ